GFVRKGESRMVGAEGLEPPTPCVWSTGPKSKTDPQGGVARIPEKPVHAVYTEPRNPGGQPGTSVSLADALRAFADAGLPPDALAAAVEALVRASKAAAGIPTAPRLVGSA